MDIGFISIRNEDGTQWLSLGMWGPRAARRAYKASVFEDIQKRAAETTRNNSPDNGFFGLMNLTWHPCTEAEAREAQISADEYEAKCDAEDIEFERQMNELYGPDEE